MCLGIPNWLHTAPKDNSWFPCSLSICHRFLATLKNWNGSFQMDRLKTLIVLAIWSTAKKTREHTSKIEKKTYRTKHWNDWNDLDHALVSSAFGTLLALLIVATLLIDVSSRRLVVWKHNLWKWRFFFNIMTFSWVVFLFDPFWMWGMKLQATSQHYGNTWICIGRLNMRRSLQKYAKILWRLKIMMTCQWFLSTCIFAGPAAVCFTAAPFFPVTGSEGI